MSHKRGAERSTSGSRGVSVGSGGVGVRRYQNLVSYGSVAVDSVFGDGGDGGRASSKRSPLADLPNLPSLHSFPSYTAEEQSPRRGGGVEEERSGSPSTGGDVTLRPMHHMPIRIRMPKSSQAPISKIGGSQRRGDSRGVTRPAPKQSGEQKRPEEGTSGGDGRVEDVSLSTVATYDEDESQYSSKEDTEHSGGKGDRLYVCRQAIEVMGGYERGGATIQQVVKSATKDIEIVQQGLPASRGRAVSRGRSRQRSRGKSGERRLSSPEWSRRRSSSRFSSARIGSSPVRSPSPRSHSKDRSYEPRRRASPRMKSPEADEGHRVGQRRPHASRDRESFSPAGTRQPKLHHHATEQRYRTPTLTTAGKGVTSWESSVQSLSSLVKLEELQNYGHGDGVLWGKARDGRTVPLLVKAVSPGAAAGHVPTSPLKDLLKARQGRSRETTASPPPLQHRLAHSRSHDRSHDRRHYHPQPSPPRTTTTTGNGIPGGHRRLRSPRRQQRRAPAPGDPRPSQSPPRTAHARRPRRVIRGPPGDAATVKHQQSDARPIVHGTLPAPFTDKAFAEEGKGESAELTHESGTRFCQVRSRPASRTPGVKIQNGRRSQAPQERSVSPGPIMRGPIDIATTATPPTTIPATMGGIGQHLGDHTSQQQIPLPYPATLPTVSVPPDTAAPLGGHRALRPSHAKGKTSGPDDASSHPSVSKDYTVASSPINVKIPFDQPVQLQQDLPLFVRKKTGSFIRIHSHGILKPDKVQYYTMRRLSEEKTFQYVPLKFTYNKPSSDYDATTAASRDHQSYESLLQFDSTSQTQQTTTNDILNLMELRVHEDRSPEERTKPSSQVMMELPPGRAELPLPPPLRKVTTDSSQSMPRIPPTQTTAIVDTATIRPTCPPSTTAGKPVGEATIPSTITTHSTTTQQQWVGTATAPPLASGTAAAPRHKRSSLSMLRRESRPPLPPPTSAAAAAKQELATRTSTTITGSPVISSQVVSQSTLLPTEPEVKEEEVITYVEVPTVKEVIREVPVQRIEYLTVEKKVPEIHYVERIVEVPQIEYLDVEEEVEEICEKLVYVPKIQVVDLPKEVIRYVPKIETNIVEKIVEIPQIVEVPVPVVVEECVPKITYVDEEVPIVVAQLIQPILVEDPETPDDDLTTTTAATAAQLSVTCTESSPEVHIVDVFVPKLVSSNATTMNAYEAHHEVNIPAAQFNTLLEKINPHIAKEQHLNLLPFRINPADNTIERLMGEDVQWVPLKPGAEISDRFKNYSLVAPSMASAEPTEYYHDHAVSGPGRSISGGGGMGWSRIPKPPAYDGERLPGDTDGYSTVASLQRMQSNGFVSSADVNRTLSDSWVHITGIGDTVCKRRSAARPPNNPHSVFYVGPKNPLATTTCSPCLPC